VNNHSVICLILINDSTIASGSGDNSIKIWNLKTNQCINTLTRHNESDNV